MKKISIIIPYYNGKEFISETLASIKKIGCDKEIIIVDDGSDAENRLYYEKNFSREPDIKILRKENSGIADTRNYGLNEAVGEYVLFVDQDDKVISETVDKAISLADKEIDDIVMWSTAKLYNNGEVKLYGQVKTDLRFHNEYECKSLIKEMLFNIDNKSISYIGCIWSAIFRLSVLKENKITFKSFIDYEDDYLFIFDAINRCHKIAAITDIGYYWRCNLKSESHRYKHIERLIDKSIAFYTYLYQESKEYLDEEFLKKFNIYVKQNFLLKAIENSFMCVGFSWKEAQKCRRMIKRKENFVAFKVPLIYPFTKRPRRIYNLVRKRLYFLAYSYVYLDSIYRVILKKCKRNRE